MSRNQLIETIGLPVKAAKQVLDLFRAEPTLQQIAVPGGPLRRRHGPAYSVLLPVGLLEHNIPIVSGRIHHRIVDTPLSQLRQDPMKTVTLTDTVPEQAVRETPIGLCTALGQLIEDQGRRVAGQAFGMQTLL